MDHQFLKKVTTKYRFSNEWILKEELQKGNHKALSYLMDVYHHPLCVYVHALSNDYEMAKDIVQNIFVKMWEDRAKASNIKSLSGYLYKAAYNQFSNQLRKDKRMLSIEEKHLEAVHEMILKEDPNYLQRQVQLVKAEILKLPPKCRETFLLSKRDGLTNIEIANYMDVSVRTVESQMHKAFKILRLNLQDKIKPILFLLFGLEPTPQSANTLV